MVKKVQSAQEGQSTWKLAKPSSYLPTTHGSIGTTDSGTGKLGLTQRCPCRSEACELPHHRCRMFCFLSAFCDGDISVQDRPGDRARVGWLEPVHHRLLPTERRMVGWIDTASAADAAVNAVVGQGVDRIAAMREFVDCMSSPRLEADLEFKLPALS